MSLFGLYPLLRSAPSMALYPLYGPLPPLQSSLSLYGHYPLYSPLSPLCTAVCPPLKLYVPSLALCPPPRYSVVLSMALSPLWSSAPYGPFLPLRRSVQPLQPSILSTALYPLYDPLFPHQPSVLSTAL
jgi:hypothetical protein